MRQSFAKFTLSLFVASALLGSYVPDADAGQRARGGAKTSVHRPASGAHAGNRASAGTRSANKPAANRSANQVNVNNRNTSNRNVSNRNVNRNTNINSSRNVDIDIDSDHHGGWGYDDDFHPLATAAAVTATVAVVGAIFTPNQMPSNCVQVMQGGVAYMQCGSTWYQPQYQGSNVTYVVVNAP